MEHQQTLENIDFHKYHCNRSSTIKTLFDHIINYKAILLRSLSCCGKSSLSKLLCNYIDSKLNENYNCLYINALIYNFQNKEEITFEKLKSQFTNNNPTLIIIDEIQVFYYTQNILWNIIKSIIQSQEKSSSLYFLLLSNSYESHPIINDIHFPKYIGIGLLLFTQNEINELIFSFENEFTKYYNNRILSIIHLINDKHINESKFKFNDILKDYIIRITEGHSGFIISILNSLFSDLFIKYIQDNKQQIRDSDNEETNEYTWIYNIIFSWFKSYEFYNFLLSSRCIPQLDNLNNNEIILIKQLLLKTYINQNNKYLRISDKTLFISLYNKQIIRHADEKLLGNNSIDASFGLDACFSSLLTSQLCFSKIISLHQNNDINTTNILNNTFIFDCIKKINPFNILNTTNTFELDKVLYNFSLEFCSIAYFYLSSEYFIHMDIRSFNINNDNNINFLLDICITLNNKLTIFTICYSSIFSLQTKDNIITNYNNITSQYTNNFDIYYIILSFESLTNSENDINKDNIILQDLNNCYIYQGLIRKDFSGMDIYCDNNKNEIIFSGHISSIPTCSLPTPDIIQSPPTPNFIHESELVKLFIGKIPRTFDEDTLRPMFEQFGKIFEISIIREKITGNHKGCAFLTYYSPTSAELAIQNLHGIHKFPGQNRPMQIKFAISENEKLEHKLFVGMIPSDVSEKQLKQLFTKFGTILELVILRDIEGNSKNCGFVKYSTHFEAVGAINALNRSFIKKESSHPLVVKFADIPSNKKSSLSNINQYPIQYTPNIPILYNYSQFPNYSNTTTPNNKKKTGPDGCNLFIMRTPLTWTDRELFMNFLPFGNILSATIFKDKITGESKCFGFVSYDNPSSARLAIQNMDGIRIQGKRLTVQLKKQNKVPY